MFADRCEYCGRILMKARIFVYQTIISNVEILAENADDSFRILTERKKNKEKSKKKRITTELKYLQYWFTLAPNLSQNSS